jgi:hypothetical protein
MKQNTQKIVSMMAADFRSSAGPIPFERLLRKHHRLLAELRESGLTWEQVSRLLAGNGVRHSNGLAFSASHLRGVFGRHRKRAPEVHPGKPAGKSPTTAAANAFLPAKFKACDGIAGSRNLVSGMPEHGMSDDPQHSSNQQISSPETQRNGSMPQDRARVLAVMRQSVRARHEPN